ncbi:MAG: Phospho-2-dehydro-3-deoxyheptonate aldolase [Candidatus Latescibacteria bacterium ADurb.Bin168]|nr:MAG: Phospho-2-dehydro-3-deoxyheptonate aldolase [Candidatus Latescibacteria bacterium ADurb.Bin168]
MIVVMHRGATQEEISHVCEHIVELGFKAHPIYGTERVVIGVIGDDHAKTEAMATLGIQPGVERVTPILKPYKRVGAEMKKERTVVNVGNAAFGAGKFAVIAGPCSVESEEQLLSTAQKVKEAGARVLRGGAFKPRTSPYAFQGLAEEGLKILAFARNETGLPFATEVVTNRDVELVARYADMLQIGARNMTNYSLLREAGATGKPVLLKRGMSATLEELLLAAEYIADEGNEQIVLCERGIRTFEPFTRNTLDLSAVPAIHMLSHLPIIVDPSHATGRSELVRSMALAAIAAEADGLIVEVHPAPEQALSDGAQSILPEAFAQLMEEGRRYLAVSGRTL